MYIYLDFINGHVCVVVHTHMPLFFGVWLNFSFSFKCSVFKFCYMHFSFLLHFFIFKCVYVVFIKF